MAQSNNQLKETLLDLLSIQTLANNITGVRDALKLIEQTVPDTIPYIKRHKSPPYLILSTAPDPMRPKVGILCHVDTVPPYFPPKIDGDKIRGRGSMDMKGPLVAALYAFLNAQNCPVTFIVTGDEEIGGQTAQKLAKKFFPDVLLVPDAGEHFNIVVANKGIMHIKVTLKGKTAHGSRPWQGDNAIEQSIALFDALKVALRVDNSEGWHNTLMFSNIRSKNAYNVIPERIKLGFDFRFIEKDLSYWEAKIANVVSQFGGTYFIKAHGERIDVADDHPALKLLHNTIEAKINRPIERIRYFGSNDGRFMRHNTSAILMFNPPGGTPHSYDEWVHLPSLVQYSEIIQSFLEQYCKGVD